jgi:hypothetical protein
VHHARVRPLLHDAGHDVALLRAVLADDGIVGDVAQPLADDLLGGVGGDAPEVFGVLLFLADDGALGVRTATWPLFRSSWARAPSGSSPVCDVCFANAVSTACSMIVTSSSNGISFSRSIERNRARSISMAASLFSSRRRTFVPTRS